MWNREDSLMVGAAPCEPGGRVPPPGLWEPGRARDPCHEGFCRGLAVPWGRGFAAEVRPCSPPRERPLGPGEPGWPFPVPNPSWSSVTPGARTARADRSPLATPDAHSEEALRLAVGGSPWLPRPVVLWAPSPSPAPASSSPNSWSWTVSSRTTRVASAGTTTACRPTPSSSLTVRASSGAWRVGRAGRACRLWASPADGLCPQVCSSAPSSLVTCRRSTSPRSCATTPRRRRPWSPAQST